MNTYLRECRAEILRGARTPAFAVPTLLMPLAFYSLFSIALATPGSGAAGYSLATYGVFAALGPSLFGFGAGLASDREAGILALKQASPLPAGVFLLARLVAALAFTAIVLVGLYAIAAWGAGVALPRGRWLALAAVHLASVVPFCLLGLCVGLRASGSAAMAVTNVLFFALAVLGGLWVPVFLFPDWLQQVSTLIPTAHLAALALGAAGRRVAGGPWEHALEVAAFTVVAAALAWRSYVRVPR
jgi:ABC-2 type transport system permease protein